MANVEIRFLRPGRVIAEVPENFRLLTTQEKLNWAFNVLNEIPDGDLVQAMSDYKEGCQGFFDETPDVAAIQTVEGEDIVSTNAWNVYNMAEAVTVVK